MKGSAERHMNENMKRGNSYASLQNEQAEKNMEEESGDTFEMTFGSPFRQKVH